MASIFCDLMHTLQHDLGCCGCECECGWLPLQQLQTEFDGGQELEASFAIRPWSEVVIKQESCSKHKSCSDYFILNKYNHNPVLKYGDACEFPMMKKMNSIAPDANDSFRFCNR
jgi:hypothetical protein